MRHNKQVGALNYLKKIFFSAIFITMSLDTCAGLVARSMPALPSAGVKFDFMNPKNSLEPTVYRLADEITILIATLAKRGELDEPNKSSLRRIRGYLVDLYHQRTVPERLKKRAYIAIKLITAELESRAIFEERYQAGLVRGKPVSARTSPLPSMETKSTSTPRRLSFRQAARRVQTVNQVARSVRPSGDESGRFYGVRENRGRRLFNLIRLGYIEEKTLGAADRQELDRYRKAISSPGATRDSQPITQRPPLQQSASLPPPPPPPVFNGAGPQSVRTMRPSTIAQARAALRPPSERKVRQVPRAAEVPPIMREIDRRIASGQIDPNRKDPNDFRDQIQGASDAEWENS